MADYFSNIRAFVGVVQSGSFSAAARMANATPSSITRQIASLEERLGVRLLNRTTRSMDLTDAGHTYYERALSLVREYDEMNQEVTDLEATPRGRLRVSASFSLGATRLASILPDFLSAYPEVSVDLVLSDRFVDLIDDKVDVALRISKSLPDSSLIARKLFRYQRIICASPAYLRQFSNPQTPQELAQHECLTFHAGGRFDISDPGGKVWTLRRDNKVEAVSVDGRIDSNSLTALIGAAMRGFGLFLAPRWVVEEYLNRGELEIVLADYEVDPSENETWVYAVYASNRFLSPKVRAFIDFIASELHEPMVENERGATAEKNGREGCS